MQVILIFSLIEFLALDGLGKFESGLVAKPAPAWLGAAGWLLTLSSLWCIPAYAAYTYTQASILYAVKYARNWMNSVGLGIR